jgi:hypothetical protein
MRRQREQVDHHHTSPDVSHNQHNLSQHRHCGRGSLYPHGKWLIVRLGCDSAVERLRANDNLRERLAADRIDYRSRCCDGGNGFGCRGESGWHKILGSKFYDQRSTGYRDFFSVPLDGDGRRCGIYIDREWIGVRVGSNRSVERIESDDNIC